MLVNSFTDSVGTFDFSSSSPPPSIGLPNVFGEYDESPETMSSTMKQFAQQGIVNIIGGCCGSTPEHIKAIHDACHKLPPRKVASPNFREFMPGTYLSGLEPFVMTPAMNFVNIGERCNVAGSKKFARLIRTKKYAEALQIAKDQVESGAQVIDINMDEGMSYGWAFSRTFH